MLVPISSELLLLSFLTEYRRKYVYFLYRICYYTFQFLISILA